MANTILIGPYIRRFLMEHLVGERNFSRNTQASYRDTLVLLLPFVASQINKSTDQLGIDDVSADRVRHFLLYLEKERNCSVATRNQRLAAIHAMARFIGDRSPEHIAWSTDLRAIPFKKTTRVGMAYLDKPEMDALLDSPNPQTAQGLRDYALLLFLYNTGTRAQEAAQVKIADLNLGNSPAVKILGKGNKIRYCPLWSLTVRTLTPLVTGRAPSECVFLNRRKQPITRFGIHALVKRYVRQAAQRVTSLQVKPVSTHTIRHATAVHLLRAGVDINTIRAWLGHVSLDTTHIYAEIDLEMKAKALAHCEILTPTLETPGWNNNQELMAFLKSL